MNKPKRDCKNVTNGVQYMFFVYSICGKNRMHEYMTVRDRKQKLSSGHAAKKVIRREVESTFTWL